MARPKLLDLFCCAGGSSRGYYDAGFDVVGVDIEPQPHYPFEFRMADALDFPLSGFDLISASPPCQGYSKTQKLNGNSHPLLIERVRERLIQSGTPYVIENVPGAPLISPIELCGSMFGLRTYRHRLFECSFLIVPPPHPKHDQPTTKMGRRPVPGEFMHVVGNFSGIKQAREAMGIEWMPRDRLREAIPPKYTEYIGRKFLEGISR